MSPVRTDREPEAPEMSESPRAKHSRGQEMGAALQAAQGQSRSNVNQAVSASGYSRIADIYNDERKASNFTNKVSGLLVSGASLTYRIQADGQVERQTADTYTVKWEATKPEALRNKAAALARSNDPEERGTALVLAVNAPYARALQAGNPELAPAIVRQNEQSRTTKEFIGMNEVAPIGDPATGRPIFSQAWISSENGGQVALYGFKKRQGADNAYLGILPSLDDKGNRKVILVDKVSFEPGVTAHGTRNITRKVTPTDLQSFSIETEKDQRSFMAQMEDKGWRPITQAPPPQADLPAKFRGLSEVNVSTRATLKMAEAVAKHDVINKGLALAESNDVSMLKDLPPFEKGLVEDFAAQANAMKVGAGLPPKAVGRLFEQMDLSMRKLGELKATVDSLRLNPAAMDPITEFRKIASDLAKANGKNASDLYKLFDNPEENFKLRVGPAAHREFSASDNLRKAVLEQLAKDLTDELGAWPKTKGEPWKDADNNNLTFPDGTPRTATPFDKALARGGAHYDQVREKYYDLMQASMNSAASFTSVQLIMKSRAMNAEGKSMALSAPEASRLATEYANAQITGKPMAKPQEEVLVSRMLADTGPSNKYLDETMRLYAFSPLVAAHRAGLSPAEFQRAMQANAQDNEPWSVAVKSYQVYSYNSVPEPSGPAAYIAPEQDLPETYDPTDVAMVESVNQNRTWRVVRLEDDDGRPTPNLVETGMSTRDMIAYRLEASEKNIPVTVARKPLPENTPLNRGLAKTFNMPIIHGADPIDGTPGSYATTGMRVSGQGVAVSVTPSYYKALRYSKAPVVDKVEPIQLMDEAQFAANGGLARARRAVEAEMKGSDKLGPILQALDTMAEPKRERGVYVIKMDEAGMALFEADRKATIQAMTACRIAMAEQAFKNEAKNLPPDLKGAKETEKNQAVETAKATGAAKLKELSVFMKDLTAFQKENSGKVGYTGFAPALGAGNPAVRIHKPPMELRFPEGTSIDLAKARLNKRGLNIELDQFRVDNA